MGKKRGRAHATEGRQEATGLISVGCALSILGTLAVLVALALFMGYYFPV